MSVIVKERLEAVRDIPLTVGSSRRPEEGCVPGEFCAMEKFAYITGQGWTDDPDNCSHVIGAFVRRFQDGTDQDGRDKVDAWIIENAERLVATANDDHDESRGLLAADWATRVALPL